MGSEVSKAELRFRGVKMRSTNIPLPHTSPVKLTRFTGPAAGRVRKHPLVLFRSFDEDLVNPRSLMVRTLSAPFI